jgi:hypothetical protein
MGPLLEGFFLGGGGVHQVPCLRFEENYDFIIKILIPFYKPKLLLKREFARVENRYVSKVYKLQMHYVNPRRLVVERDMPAPFSSILFYNAIYNRPLKVIPHYPSPPSPLDVISEWH